MANKKPITVEQKEQTNENINTKSKISYPNEITNIKQLHFEYIFDYIEQLEDEDVDWLDDLIQSVETDKNGVERPLSFISIRKAFVEKYMPHLKTEPKPKAITATQRMVLLRERRKSKAK